MGFFDFLKSRRPTEEEILIDNVKPEDFVLDVAPYVWHADMPILGDPSLQILIKKINCRNLTIIDIKGDPKADVINLEAQKYVVGRSDLFATKDYVRKITNNNINYVVSDALNTPFPNQHFDIILDRITHQFIVSYWNYEWGPYDRDKLDKLIYEYNRILKRNGKILFFTSHKNKKLHNLLADGLRTWSYAIISGKLKKIRNQQVHTVHETKHYIIATKPNK